MMSTPSSYRLVASTGLHRGDRAYQQDQVAFYGNYAEFAQAQENVENAVIAFKDNTVVMVIASNECTADLDSAVDSALGE